MTSEPCLEKVLKEIFDTDEKRFMQMNLVTRAVWLGVILEKSEKGNFSSYKRSNPFEIFTSAELELIAQGGKLSLENIKGYFLKWSSAQNPITNSEEDFFNEYCQRFPQSGKEDNFAERKAACLRTIDSLLSKNSYEEKDRLELELFLGYMSKSISKVIRGAEKWREWKSKRESKLSKGYIDVTPGSN